MPCCRQFYAQPRKHSTRTTERELPAEVSQVTTALTCVPPCGSCLRFDPFRHLSALTTALLDLYRIASLPYSTTTIFPSASPSFFKIFSLFILKNTPSSALHYMCNIKPASATAPRTIYICNHYITKLISEHQHQTLQHSNMQCLLCKPRN